MGREFMKTIEPLSEFPEKIRDMAWGSPREWNSIGGFLERISDTGGEFHQENTTHCLIHRDMRCQVVL